jgi:8-oxo-dGTP pyrophosphatase MutT (NUDIX family)
MDGDEKSVELIEMLLQSTETPCDRSQFSPGHLTATGLVIDSEARVAMVLHARLGRWLLPGGHVEEADISIQAAAAREVLEETGLEVRDGRIIGADVHGIPAKWNDGVVVEPYHLHHDVLVLFRVHATDLCLSEESEAVRWVRFDEFDTFNVPANVRRAYARARRRELQ